MEGGRFFQNTNYHFTDKQKLACSAGVFFKACDRKFAATLEFAVLSA